VGVLRFAALTLRLGLAAYALRLATARAERHAHAVYTKHSAAAKQSVSEANRSVRPTGRIRSASKASRSVSAANRSAGKARLLNAPGQSFSQERIQSHIEDFLLGLRQIVADAVKGQLFAIEGRKA
jgi:hypothetical protein